MEQRIKDLFATAVELPVTERYRFLAGLPTEDRRLREELARLLEADVKNGCGIIDAVEEAAQSLLDQDGVIGSRIGAYRIMDEIGRGGMGTVYLAVRDDDHYEKQVAIKVIRRGMDTDDMLHRFRNERQVLANLDHPYIASLLDGGAAPDGRPFLVMEFVRGAPLDVYCNEEKLDLRGRCRLFLKVCEAVAFAHRNLIVHRDLKPGNILVSNDGVPKLLDFGLSKLLNGESGGRTTVTARPVTPEFASPEMIRAEQITTAADVYSLGAILYELLSGERAHRFVSQGFREVERVVCEVEPPLPSARAQTFRRQLQGDLDAIISMAMRKEPAARYATVDQFAADIERYLNGWPVTARHGDLAYRTRKFLRRNRAAIAVGGLLAGTLIAGATIASIEAKHAAREQIRAEQQRQRAVESQTRAEASQREAEHQRQFAEEQRRQADWQRVTAETQRQLADRRFQQVRQLANKFLLEFHDSIAKLPGSTPARKMVVETGLRYYDTLVKEADRGTNRELLGEIAQGYTRLGDVQGNPYYASLGDLDGALASYRKALALREKISDSTAESVADHMRARVKVAQLLTVKGEVENAVSTLQAAIRSGEQFQTALAVKEALAQAYVAEGDLWNRTGDHAKSIEPYLKHLTLRKEMAQAHPGSPVSDISLAHTKLGDSYARLGRAEDALPHFRIVLPIDQKLAEGDPNSMPRLRKLYVDYFLLGFVIRSNPGLDYSEFGGERAVMETATKIAARMAAADPENSAVHLDVLGSESSLGDWLRNHSEFEEALIHYRKALAAAARHAGGGPPSLSSYDALIQAHHRMASGLREAGQFEESLQYFRIAEEYLTKAEEKNPGLKRFAKRHAEIASGRGRVYQSRGEWKRAIDNFETSIAIFEKSRTKGGPEGEEAVVLQVPLYGMLANCYAALEEWQNAIRSAQCSLSRLEEIAKRRPLLAHEESQRKESMAKLEKWGPQTQR
jgi:tetratricopeptide (TPR) repeat protein